MTSAPTVTTEDDIRRWVTTAAKAADAKQGVDIVVLDVGEVLAITGWFVITSAPNDRLVRTIAEEVEHQVAEGGGPRPLRVEGLDDLRWVLMDYGDFVVHVFRDDARHYYDLERLWRDVPQLDWAALP
jgi:ribosome-associated protein